MQKDGKAQQVEISIHAPREGGDSDGLQGQRLRHISIHAPREGGDHRRS